MPIVVCYNKPHWPIRFRGTLELIRLRVFEQNDKCEMRDGRPRLVEARCQAQAKANARTRCLRTRVNALASAMSRPSQSSS